LIVLTQTDLQAAKVFAERIRECVENSFFPDLGPNSRVTVSIGLAEHRTQENIEKMIPVQMNLCTKQKKGDATVWNGPTKDEDTTIVNV